MEGERCSREERESVGGNVGREWREGVREGEGG